MGDTRMHIYEFGPFRVDVLRRLLLREGNQVRLPAKAFEILLVLLEGKGRLVEKDELMRKVWPDSVVEENNLTVNMSALRRSLAESPGEHRYVVTVPGRGYQFVADVRQHGGDEVLENEQEALPDQGAVISAERDSGNGEAEAFSQNGNWGSISGPAPVVMAQTNGVASQTHTLSSAEYIGGEIRQHKHGVLLFLAAMLATTIIVSYLVYSRYLAGHSKAGITSIAVLPFANKTGDPDAEYLSDGISDSLINSLSQVPGLRVIARSSSFKYKGKEVDIQEVARALGVDEVLTGRVLQRGDGLIISVELVNASDKTQMWGEQYDRKMSDLLATQREIALEIVERLKLKVSGEEKGPAKHYTESNEAYQLYLKGRFYWNKRTAEALRKGIEYFNQAIDKDPRFALAYAGLADCYVVPGNRLPPREAMPKAKAAAIRALELDETLAEAHASLGRVFAAYDWDWTGAEREYKRAIELNPRYATVHQWYGGYLSLMGRSNEAIAERKRALELEPLSLVINFELGLAFYYARDYDRAIEQFQKTLELDQSFPPAYNFLPAVYEQNGMYSEAIAEFKKGIPLVAGSEGTLAKAGLGHVYAVTGKKGDARTLIDELKQLSAKEYLPATSVALIYAGLDEKDQAFAWLDKGYEERAFQMQWIKLDPRWDSLRSDPRFKDLMRRMGFAQ
ncbi:MAG TPA: winged helix-turn-helix domain-containing protein [Pyrinomonadaceae bacterium]|nr:winged helix-turn-helix domain-containing protein [Pyrinomonadaceae bacterium]